MYRTSPSGLIGQRVSVESPIHRKKKNSLAIALATLSAMAVAGHPQLSSASVFYWDPSNSHSPAGSGGAGDLLTSNTGTPWYQGYGSVDVAIGSSNDLVLAGAPSTSVSNTSNIIANSLAFNTGGYILTSGNTDTLVSGIVNVNSGTTTLAAKMAGTSGLTVNSTATGTLILGNTASAPTYTGTTTINSGATLSFLDATSSFFTTTNPIVVNSGTFDFGNATNTNALSIPAISLNGGTLASSNGAIINLSGTVNSTGSSTINSTALRLPTAATAAVFNVTSGTLNITGGFNPTGTTNATGIITKNGAGTLDLSGTSTGLSSVAATTVINRGTLLLDYTTNNTNKLGTGLLTLNAGTLQVNGSAGTGTLTVNGLTLGGGAATINIASGQTSIALGTINRPDSGANGLIGGAVNFINAGSGTSITTTAGIEGGNSNGSGIIGAYAIFTSGTTQTWATQASSASTSVVGFSTFASATGNSGITIDPNHESFDLSSASPNPANTNVATLRYNTPNGSSTITTNAAMTFKGLYNGILMTGNMGSTNVVISSGSNQTLSGDLYVHQYNTGSGTLSINDRLSVAGGFTSSLIKDGPGTLILGFNGTEQFGTNGANGFYELNGGLLSTAFATSTGNLQSGGNSGLVFNGGGLQLTGNGQTVPNAATLNLGGGTVDVTGANSDTMSGVFSGAGSLAKTDSGTLILSGTNTYTGATTVNGGTLKAGFIGTPGTNGAFGVNSAVTMANTTGAALDITGFNTQIGSLTGGGTTGGNVIFGAAILSIGGDNTSPATYGGTISGVNGVITKIGNGTLGLSGTTNSYTGGTNINVGTLNFANGALGTTGTITFGGGTLQYAAGNTQDLSGRVASSAAISVDTNGNTVTFGSAIGSGNSHGLTKLGAGTLILSASNTYTGGTTVNIGGTLQVTNTTGSATGTTGVTVTGGGTLSGSSSAGQGTVAGLVTVNGGGQISAFSGATLTLSGGLNLDSGGTTTSSPVINLALSGTPNGTSNPLVNVGGTLTVGSTAKTFINLTNTSAPQAGTYDLIGSAAAVSTGNFNTAVTGGPAGPFNYSLSAGTNQLDLNVNVAALTWAGQNNGNGAANTSWDTTTTSMNFANGTSPSYYANGGSVVFADVNAANGNSAVANPSTVVIQTAGVQPATVAFSNSNETYTVSNASSSTTGIAGSTALTKNGVATLTLSSTNTYTGGTIINAGTINFANNALGTTGNISFGGGTLQYVSGNTQDLSARIFNSTAAITIDTNGNTVNFSSSLDNSNTAGLTKLGTGTLTLSSATGNAYSGPTIVANGTFLVNNTSGSGTTAVSVGSATAGLNPTLGGTGIIGAAIKLNAAGTGSGGHFAPGNGGTTIGSLTSSGTFTLETGSALDYDFGASGSSDRGVLTATANGNLVFPSSGVTLNMNSNTGGFSGTGSYELFSYNSAATPASFVTGFNGGTVTGNGTAGSFTLAGFPTGVKYTLMNDTTNKGIFLTFAPPVSATTYTLTASAGSSRILTGTTTSVTSTITNTGTGSADTLNFTGLGASNSITGSTTSGGPLANSGGSSSNTGLTFTGAGTGNQTITPIVTTATNHTGGGSATLTTTNTTIVDVVAARSFNQSTPNPVTLGNVFVSTPTSAQNATFSTTGANVTTTNVTVNANATVTDGSATLSNGATAQVFSGPDGAAHSGTLSVTGNFATAGTDAGTVSLTAGNGLTAEFGASGNLAIAYTANVFDHASIGAGASPLTMRLTQGASKSVSYSLTNAGASAQRDSGTVSSGGSASAGFSTNFALPVTVAAGTSSGLYTATYTAAAANGTSSPTGTYNFTYGDTDNFTGQQTGQTATLTVNTKVDAIAEHVTTNTDTGNANTTSTAAYRQLAGYSGNDLGTATVTKTGPGSYEPGYIDNINGGLGVSRGTATVAVVPSGQSFNGETGVFLLDFGDPSTDLTTNLTALDADLAAGGYAFYDDVTGASNGVATNATLAAVDPHLGAGGAGHAYDLELDLGGTGTTNPTYFDFDFGKYNTGTGLEVDNLAVIPEPSAAIAMMGVAMIALLPRRRRQLR